LRDGKARDDLSAFNKITHAALHIEAIARNVVKAASFLLRHADWN
jgi:hypothetical protein